MTRRYNRMIGCGTSGTTTETTSAVGRRSPEVTGGIAAPDRRYAPAIDAGHGAEPKNVVLLGKGDLAIRIGTWFVQSPDHVVVCVVPSSPEPTWTSSLTDWAVAARLPVVTVADPQVVADAAGTDCFHLAFSCFYSTLLRPPFLDACDRALNLHNAPLPRYRGVSPINWALKNGERMHGVTIHEITPGVDDGPIVSQVQFTIDPDIDEVIDVYRRALAFGWTLFEQTMPALDRITPRPQDHSLALTYRRRDNVRLGERSGFTRAASESH